MYLATNLAKLADRFGNAAMRGADNLAQTLRTETFGQRCRVDTKNLGHDGQPTPFSLACHRVGPHWLCFRGV